MFFEIGVLKNFAIFRGIIFRGIIKLQACNFPVNIAKVFRTGFFLKQLRWLLLKNS